MSILQELVVKLGLDSADYQSGLAGAASKAQDFGSKISGWIGGLAIGAAVVSGLVIVKNTLEDCAKAAMEAEDADAKLNAILRSTNSVSGMTIKSLNDQAAAIQKVTRFDDELVKAGQATLLTMTNIGVKVFPRATQAMVDMAAKTGSLESAALILGKALNDPIGGLGALAKVGVELSDSQTEQIKQFMAVNDVVSAQGVILGQVEKTVGGLAEAMGATSEGQMEIFKHQVGEIKEKIGDKLLPVINEVTKGLVNWLTSPEGEASVATFVGWIGKVMGTVSPPTGLAGIVGYLMSGDIKNAVDLAFGEGTYASLKEFVEGVQRAADDIAGIIADMKKAWKGLQDYYAQHPTGIAGVAVDVAQSRSITSTPYSPTSTRTALGVASSGSISTPRINIGGGISVPGYASGGSFTVPGSGSGDRPYALMASPGEEGTIRTKGQQDDIKKLLQIIGSQKPATAHDIAVAVRDAIAMMA